MEEVKVFVNNLEDDSQAIISAKDLLQDDEIPAQLVSIKANFAPLVKAISALEERIPLVQSVDIVENVKKHLLLEPFASKLNFILNKNPGYQKMRNIANLLIGNGSGSDLEGENPVNMANFANAPLTSVDCERAFSKFKDLLSSKRQCFTEEHLKHQMILQWNSSSTT